MDTQKVATEYRMSQWAQVIRERQQSNQTINEFCELRGISRHAFFYWQRKLRQAVCTKLSELEKTANSTPAAVSYTHLDVYKRQPLFSSGPRVKLLA